MAVVRAQDKRENAIARARERNVLIPTFRQMVNPDLIPSEIKQKLRGVSLWDTDPANLFRISWKNEPVEAGGAYGGVNYIEFPPELSGVEARVIALVGKWFPTGSHKVGATFGCLAPKLVSGMFDPTTDKAVWPSTGNYCRGGAFDAALLGCESIAILPEGMSRERFDWLARIAGEVITTPGGESNVKEIFDACSELKRLRDDVVVFNQFSEYGNHLWHYYVTGRAMEEVLEKELAVGCRFAGFVSQSGSSGTLGAGDYLKERYPTAKVVVGEALQCPTLLMNGHGDHRIEGIGDKHVPWIHNVRNTDLVVAVDDEACLRLLRLFNEPEGVRYLRSNGVDDSFLAQLHLMGISGIGNLLSAVKFAKYFDLTSRDVVMTVLTDPVDMYRTRVDEMRQINDLYGLTEAAVDANRYLWGESTDNMMELDYNSRQRIHLLKYFTWVEQWGMSVEELDAQWNEFPEFWDSIHGQVEQIDLMIEEFNERTGVLRGL